MSTVQISERISVNLSVLVGGLKIRSAECVLYFDQRAPLRPLATATIRGLAGHLLTATQPDLVGRWFKRGHQAQLSADRETEESCGKSVGFKPSHLPPAYLFEALRHEFAFSESLPFCIRTWDQEGELLPAFLNALKLAGDRPFGETGVKIRSASFSQIERWEFEESRQSIRPAAVEFLTPVRLKASGRWLGKFDVTLGHLVEAAIRRLDLLSVHYGNKSALSVPAFISAASKVRETARSLDWVSPRRRSSSQGIDIELSGLVGEIRFAEIPGMLVDLLNAAALFHIGHKTAEGCGQFRLIG